MSRWSKLKCEGKVFMPNSFEVGFQSVVNLLNYLAGH